MTLMSTSAPTSQIFEQTNIHSYDKHKRALETIDDVLAPMGTCKKVEIHSTAGSLQILRTLNPQRIAKVSQNGFVVSKGK
jgi:hypothetical protein